MRKLLLLCVLSVLFIGQAFAQKTVSGKVTDSETGEALPAVSIGVKGTTTGTVTDFDGNYRLSVPEGGVLVFSFVGFQSQEVEIGNQTTINISLAGDNKVLTEVVVVGYGEQTKGSITGSISSLATKDIQNIPVPSLEGAMQGRSAGVFIEQGNGKLGGGIKMRIRGASSISASSQPLYVIDGIPVTSQSQSATNATTNPLADLNFNDVESMEILKDAASAAIYGSRAANGVILITTKRGKEGKTKFNLGYQTGISNPTGKREFLNADQYVTLFREAVKNRYGDDTAFDDVLDGYAVGTNWRNREVNTNWQDQVFQKNAGFQQVDLSINGGNEKTKFYISGGLLDQNGILIKNRFQRYSGRVNLEHAISDKVKIGLNMGLSLSKNRRVADDNQFSTPMQIVALAPIIPIRNKEGNLTDAPETGMYYNPLVEAEYGAYNTNVFRNLSNAYLAYEPIKGLTLRGEFGADILNQNEDRFWGSKTEVGRSVGNTASAQIRWVQIVNYTSKAYATYNKAFDKHNFDFLLGTEYNYAQSDRTDTQAQGIPVDNLQTLASASKVTVGTSDRSFYAFLSYFSRINYQFDNKYLIGITARYDGSSRFGEANRFGVFPSMSAGWVLSREEFLKDIKALSFLKLRGSYGLTGNAEIANFGQLGLFGTAKYAEVGGLAPTQIANPSLQWEKTLQTDIGLEFGFLNDRITGEIDFFHKNTYDLLLNVPVPTTSGFSTQLRNAGKLKNWGWEFSVTSNNVVGDFGWKTTFNLTLPRNEITDLGDLPNGLIDGGGSRYANVAKVGSPIGVFYGAEYAGVNPENGAARWFVNDPKNLSDRSMTENFNAANFVVIGNPNPTHYGGINNIFTYKGLELSIFFQWVSGNQVHNAAGSYMSGSMIYEDNQTVDQLNRWQKPGDITDVPRPSIYRSTGTQSRSSRYLSDASYLRLKTLNLSYNLPTEIAKKAFMQSVRLYVTAQNLLTFTSYKGWDPEVNTDFLSGASTQSGNIYQGVDFYAAPQAQTITFGLNLGF